MGLQSGRGQQLDKSWGSWSSFLPVYTTKANNSLRKATSRVSGQVHPALGAEWSTGYQGDIHVPHQYPAGGLLSYQAIKTHSSSPYSTTSLSAAVSPAQYAIACVWALQTLMSA